MTANKYQSLGVIDLTIQRETEANKLSIVSTSKGAEEKICALNRVQHWGEELVGAVGEELMLRK